MNGMRSARKYIEKQGTKELIRLQRLAQEENTPEGMVVYYLIVSELERRNVEVIQKNS